MLNSHSGSLLQAQLRALHVARFRHGEADAASHPVSSTLTMLMQHGGLYSLLDENVMAARLNAVASTQSGHHALIPHLRASAESFFIHLVPNKPYTIPSSLVSYISFPHEGITYSPAEKTNPGKYESKDIPAVFTFVGQFIDHDLTMNALDLFTDQTGAVGDGASPLIDLDSVYGPRATLSSLPGAIYDGDKFRHVHRADGVIDLPRTHMDNQAVAAISDMRNDENQLILQIHILVESMHNKFVAEGKSFKQAREHTILNWQYMILHDYLPRIVQKSVLADVVARTESIPVTQVRSELRKNRAFGRLNLNMPHEFAIGFRFGHSQLKDRYRINARSDYVMLFNNYDPGHESHGFLSYRDLRGHQNLTADHQIDWNIFYPQAGFTKANEIDTKVTAPVFNLPESAIPDNIKFVGNLVQRNLIRSSQVGLCSGEDLAHFYGITPLTPDQVEPNTSRQFLFMRNETVVPASKAKFETPLWYYLLREAEVAREPGGSSDAADGLGPLGSRLIAEVLVGAIFYPEISVFRPGTWTPLPGAPGEHFRNILKFAYGI